MDTKDFVDFLNDKSIFKEDDLSGMGSVDITILSTLIISYLTGLEKAELEKINQQIVNHEVINKEKIEREITIVEVGSWKGRSALTIANAIRNLRNLIDFNIKTTIYCVDQVWKGGKEFYPDNINVFQYFQNNVKKFNQRFDIDTGRIKIEPVIMNSKEASSTFDDKSLDIVFVDGDHRYEGFKNDLQLWYPKLKIGGLFFGHDCECYFTDLTDIQKEMLYDKKNKDEDTVMISDDKSVHGGVVLGMYETFRNNFKIIGSGNNYFWIKG